MANINMDISKSLIKATLFLRCYSKWGEVKTSSLCILEVAHQPGDPIILRECSSSVPRPLAARKRLESNNPEKLRNSGQWEPRGLASPPAVLYPCELLDVLTQRCKAHWQLLAHRCSAVFIVVLFSECIPVVTRNVVLELRL